MKKLCLLFFFLTFTISLFGQVKPVENLSWTHWYDYGNNYFKLEWEEPKKPHNQIIGYNIYRENNLFIFINETSIYNVKSSVTPPNVSNCGGEDFILYSNLNGFTAYVTVVYSDEIESDPKSIEISGPLLSTDKNEHKKVKIYPNPSEGLVNIQNSSLIKIQIFNLNGKLIKECKPDNEIDLSEISKGVYLIKLFSEKNVSLEKLILK
ncbi:T9SS type A sorting domain-containing protein [Mesonia aquimarina]|uniref:T9SS type A sorting domain-containing protein n=1 Tax=Mesonia aquimarina TaxID=1504967 RepID=UPI000EF592C9|nr:T9SS type A sorting domain-containing protein [Mesonia aquimarina]